MSTLTTIREAESPMKMLIVSNEDRLDTLCIHAKSCRKLNDRTKPKTLCNSCLQFDKVYAIMMPNSVWA